MPTKLCHAGPAEPEDQALAALRAEFERMYASMQTGRWRDGVDVLFTASAAQLNRVAARRIRKGSWVDGEAASWSSQGRTARERARSRACSWPIAVSAISTRTSSPLGPIAAGKAVPEANELAWRLGYDRLRTAIDRGDDFAFETTLGGKSILGELHRALKLRREVRGGPRRPRFLQLHIARVRARETWRGAGTTSRW